jgi:hypothetical protein
MCVEEKDYILSFEIFMGGELVVEIYFGFAHKSGKRLAATGGSQLDMHVVT